MISVIVPLYNEEAALSRNCAQLSRLSREAELIFVDGESADRGADLARMYGKVYHGSRGRAAQMNYGASLATGEVLLFLHADSIISPGAVDAIETKLLLEGYIGGCCTQRINNTALIYRLIEAQGNLRARLTKEFYGDQGIFVRKDVFDALGGFPEVPIMEDLLFTRKMRKEGLTVVLQERIVVSARRWEKEGIVKTTLLFNLILLLFWLKMPLDAIKRLYTDIR